MLANQLGRQGVRASIIDRHAGPALQTRALGVQARTLEIYSHLGVAGLAQEADRVIARLRQPDGTVREVTAAWVAGCDGAQSAVRKLNDIAFLGAPYEHVFFVADTQVTGPMVTDEINVYLWRSGFHLF